MPLKASSLSDLRRLQQQAAGQRAPARDRSDDTGHQSSGPDVSSTDQGKRRPHRFLPPRPGPVTTSNEGGRVRAPSSNPSTGSAMPGSSAVSGNSTGPASSATSNATNAINSHSHNTAPGKTTLTDEDIALFRRVVESVTRRPKTDRLVLPPVPPAPPGQLRERRQHAMGKDAMAGLEVSDQYASGLLEHDDTVFLQAGQGPHLIKGLKKGKWPVQASLDLHGSNLDEARERMDRFIQSCREHEIRCVRIVHGKGYGSKDGSPVLKETVRRWLSQLAAVQAYIESDEANGGAGAVLVLLSKPKP